MSNWVKVATTGEIADDDVIGVDIERRSIAVYHTDGDFFATDNICSHAYARLCDGILDDGLIQCPLHDGRFDIRTGKGQGHPITRDIKAYPVRVVGEDVEVDLE